MMNYFKKLKEVASIRESTVDDAVTKTINYFRYAINSWMGEERKALDEKCSVIY